MKRIILFLILIFPTIVNAQDIQGNTIRLRNEASIGEQGGDLNMNNNKVINVQDPTDLLDAVNLQYFTNNMSLTQPLDSLSLTPLTDSDIQTPYTMFADTLSYGGAFNTGIGNYVYKLGQSTVLLYYNDNAYTIEAFDVLHLKSGTSVNGELYPTPELADASDWEKTQGTLSVAAHPIPPNSFGFSVIYGRLKGGNTSGLTAGSQLWLSDDGSGKLTSSRPSFQSYAISMGGAFNSAAFPNGEVFINITRDIYDTFNDAWDGSIRETFNFTTESDGVTITGSLENTVNTKDLTLIFSDGFYTFDTTPSSEVTLVAGIATDIQLNYIYIDKATKTLQTSTAGFPVDEHCKIALVGVFDALTTQSNGAIRNQNINDHIKEEGDNGHILHIAERLRQFNAEWDSGAETTLNGTPTNVYFSNNSGKVYQMHRQTFPAQDMALGDDIHVVNDPTTPYRTTTNLNDITEFSDGSSWNNEWSNLVVWGVCNKTGETSHLMVNLPSDGYNSEEDAFNDNENFTDYNIPKDFKGVGFLLGRFTIRKSGANFTYNLSNGYLDLRGFVPNNTAGSGGGGASGITEFTSLTDTPNSYTTFGGQAAVVNVGETALEFSPVVTSINGISPTIGNYDIILSSNKVGEDVTVSPQGTGTGTTFSIADNDNNASNEIQDLDNTKLNNTITITPTLGGASTTITDIPRTDFANVYSNTDLNTGLNSDRLDSQEGSYYLDLVNATGILPILNGGTGSATKNFVDLTTNQIVDGVKNFSNTVNVFGLILRGNLATPNIAGDQFPIILNRDETESLTTDVVYNVDRIGTMRTYGAITAPSFVRVGGTSSQFLKADGSVDSNTYLTSADVDDVTLDRSDRYLTLTNQQINVGLINLDTHVTGVLADGNLSSNVALVNQLNDFSNTNLFRNGNYILGEVSGGSGTSFDAMDFGYNSTLRQGLINVGTTSLSSSLKVNTSVGGILTEFMTCREDGDLQLQRGSFNSITGGFKVNGTKVIDESRNIVNAGSGTFSGQLLLNSRGNIPGGNILMGATDNNTVKFTALVSRQYASNSESEGFSMISTNTNETSNGVTIGGGLFEQNAATYINFNIGATVNTVNGTTKFKVDNTGTKTIGNHEITGTATATNFILSSDERLKNFKDEPIADLSSVKIRKFTYNDDETQRDRYGVSAQKFQEIAPEMVYVHTDENKTLRVGYIHFLLAKIAIKDRQIQDLQKQILNQDNRLDRLEKIVGLK